VGGASCFFQTDANARFFIFLAPGSYTAVARDPGTSNTVGTFPFTIVAGQITDAGII
jgi:hypothetical protein